MELEFVEKLTGFSYDGSPRENYMEAEYKGFFIAYFDNDATHCYISEQSYSIGEDDPSFDPKSSSCDCGDVYDAVATIETYLKAEADAEREREESCVTPKSVWVNFGYAEDDEHDISAIEGKGTFSFPIVRAFGMTFDLTDWEAEADETDTEDGHRYLSYSKHFGDGGVKVIDIDFVD